MITFLACAGQKPFDTAALKNSKPRSLVLVVRPPGPFLFRSTKPLEIDSKAAAAGGLVGYGVVAMIERREANLREGKALKNAAGLPDPAAEIGDELIDSLGVALGLTPSTVVLRDGDPLESGPEPMPEESLHSRGDLVLYIRTEKWSLLPKKAHRNTEVSLHYKSRVRFELVDLRGGNRQRLVTGECETGTDGHNSHASYEDMLAGSGTLLNDVIERSIAVCTDRFKAILSGAPPQPMPAQPNDPE